MTDVETATKIRPLLATLVWGASNGASQAGWRYTQLSLSRSLSPPLSRWCHFSKCRRVSELSHPYSWASVMSVKLLSCSNLHTSQIRCQVKTRNSEFTIAFPFFSTLSSTFYTSLLLTGGRVLSVYREMQLRYQSGCYPRESIQRVRRTEEQSLASVDHFCTSSWAFNSLPAWVLREILGKFQQGCSLNGRRSLQRWMKDTLALVGFFM